MAVCAPDPSRDVLRIPLQLRARLPQISAVQLVVESTPGHPARGASSDELWRRAHGDVAARAGSLMAGRDEATRAEFNDRLERMHAGPHPTDADLWPQEEYVQVRAPR